MGENSVMGSEWLFAILIIIVLIGGGGLFGGNNAVTMADINASNNAQTQLLNSQQILLSSQQNNYETARLISDQTQTYLNQTNSNTLLAVNGFNAVQNSIMQGFSQTAQAIADLGYRMDRCCCEIKTQMLQDRLQDVQFALQNAQDIANNANQSMYLISQLKTTTA